MKAIAASLFLLLACPQAEAAQTAASVRASFVAMPSAWGSFLHLAELYRLSQILCGVSLEDLTTIPGLVSAQTVNGLEVEWNQNYPRYVGRRAEFYARARTRQVARVHTRLRDGDLRGAKDIVRNVL